MWWRNLYKDDSAVWTFKVSPKKPEFGFNYDVTVYRDGTRISSGWVDTLWGARYKARRLRKRYYKALRRNGLEGKF